MSNDPCVQLLNTHTHTKVPARSIIFPFCKYSVLVYPTGFDFFHSKIKALKRKKEKTQSEMSDFTLQQAVRTELSVDVVADGGFQFKHGISGI